MLRIRISDEAQADIDSIREYSIKEHGIVATDRYDLLIKTVIRQLRSEPGKIGAKSTLKGLTSYHLSMSKNDALLDEQIVRNPRHLIFFRVLDDVTPILEIARVLKDDMDFQRHL